MPKVLIIDNTTVHLPKLVALVKEKLPGADISIEKTLDAKASHVRDADLVILSGGTGLAVETSPQTFTRLVRLVEKYGRPTIGICLGAEAIAVHYGAKLEEMPVRRVGNIPAMIKDGGFSGFKAKRIMVYEFHKWKITNLDEPLVELATTKDGTEIFKHQSRPIYGFQSHPEVRHNNNRGHKLFEVVLTKIL